MSITVKANDVGVLFSDTLTDGAGDPVDLTNATVLFLMRCGSTSISRTATVVSAAAGTVTYTTVAGDLATPGNYEQEWEATYVSGAKRTFPSDGYNTVRVISDLNPS